MRTYDLYLESGPQQRKTLVHVIELLGCVANGGTTDEAVAATPDAIRAYVRYLRRHSEPVDPDEPFSTRIAEHITTGDFLGQGSPQAVYQPDLRPLTPKDLDRYLRWLEWSRADLLALVDGIDERRLYHKPQRGRSLREILDHVLGADQAYVYGLVGPLKSMGNPTNAAARGALDLREALRQAREAAIARLRLLTPEERRAVRRHGKTTRTARNRIRRMLEHEWEHRREIAARLGDDA
ncbi:MAG: hypothetical protein AUH85_16015 [Chloroflexi bacterium 13_1_40CM_4_68_4]|nr:MAG: hypothetical protein AUH85_16015 [Chloroflexi bacterium 13_1_40CM_4_68_4]